MTTQKNRRIAAIMFTDIVGYTALMQQDEKTAVALRMRHRKAFKSYHKIYHGEIVQYYGDGTLSVFSSGVEAVECAIALQTALQKEKVVPLRIGLHMGDIFFDSTEVYGDGVNLTSRIENLGVSGSILLSSKLNEELKNQAHITTKSLGFTDLKNVTQPIEVFAVANQGIYVPKPHEFHGILKKENKTVAVLPFVNMSSQADNEYFSDGMTEEIINALSKIKALKVTSRTSSFHFKNKALPITQIGKALQVSTILEGSIRLSGNKMRITAQLIDVTDDFHFWSETFDRSLDDIFTVQDEISLLIADKLREHIGHFEIAEQLVKNPELPVDTYKKYLESRYHLLKMGKSDIETGLLILKGIIEKEPNFALAHIGMHLGYTLLGTIGLLPAEEAFSKGQPFLDRAIELDENLPECQLHLSYMCFLQKWDLKSTYQHLIKAYEIRPTVEYYQSMASTLVAEGKSAAAQNYIETALQIDPFSSINYHLKGFIAYCDEHYGLAISSFEKAVELKSDFTVSTLYHGQSLLLTGQTENAKAFFGKLPPDEDGDIMKLGGTTLVHAALGNTSKAKEGIEKLEAILKTDAMGRAMNILILCHALLGMEEKTLGLIEQGVRLRLPMMLYLFVEPILKPLRELPRFRKAMKEVFGSDADFDISKGKYKKPLLNKKVLKTYRDKLAQLMSSKEPFLNPELTLRDLAQMLDIPPNQLSQLLNDGFNQNFSEFVNSYRLNTFKQKVANPKERHLTLLALAYDSGFNSKTVFNTFFKKSMGITPSAYWKKMMV